MLTHRVAKNGLALDPIANPWHAEPRDRNPRLRNKTDQVVSSERARPVVEAFVCRRLSFAHRLTRAAS
ncbi:MAG TPA: hypothetical protein VFA48_04885 [Gammaproteobacteria bacterium]|nr:hypothetical protein [Gammaproteobacteria bacterium]